MSTTDKQRDIYVPVGEVFSSMQGEGLNAGRMATFFRVQGCDLACEFCDTKTSWRVTEQDKCTTAEIRSWIRDEVEKYRTGLLVITGGEPSLYAGKITRIVTPMLPDLRFVDVETNGYAHGDEVWLELAEKCAAEGIVFTLSVSPKFGVVKYPFRELTLSENEVTMKLVVSSAEDARNQLDELESLFNWSCRERTFLQPIDGDMGIAKELVRLGLWGCRLSMQQHKIIGLK